MTPIISFDCTAYIAQTITHFAVFSDNKHFAEYLSRPMESGCTDGYSLAEIK